MKAYPGVVHFFRSTQVAERYLSVQTAGEIRHGIENPVDEVIIPKLSGLRLGSIGSWMNMPTSKLPQSL